MTNALSSRKSLLPFKVIEAAVGGDVVAINDVLKYYEGYIIALSTKRMYDKYGNSGLCVDLQKRRRLETKLITALLSFNVA